MEPAGPLTPIEFTGPDTDLSKLGLGGSGEQVSGNNTSLSKKFDIMIEELREIKMALNAVKQESNMELKQLSAKVNEPSSQSSSSSEVDWIPERSDKVDLFIRISVINVGDIDTLKQEFYCDLYMAVKWREPLLKGRMSRSDIDWSKEWDPRIYFHNAVSYDTFEKKHQLGDTSHEKGPLVKLFYRMKGTFKEVMELNDFPFDYQGLNLILTSDWNVNLISLNRDDLREDNIQTWTFTAKQEWELQSHVLTSKTATDNEQGTSRNRYPIYNVTLHVKRKYSFYVYNIALIMWLITGLTFSSFVIDAKDPGNRLQVTLTLLLTAVAFKFAVTQLIPPVSYQTLMDRYILFCLIFLFSMSVQNAVSGGITNSLTQKLFEQITLYIAVGTFVLSNTVFLFISFWKVGKVNRLKEKQAEQYNSNIEQYKSCKREEEALL